MAVRLVVKVAIDIEQALFRREKLREWIDHPGTKIIANELRLVARNAMMKQCRYNPFTQPEKIVQERLLVHVLNTVLPEIIEGIVNYDTDTIDKQVAPKKRWKLLEWLKKFCGKR